MRLLLKLIVVLTVIFILGTLLLLYILYSIPDSVASKIKEDNWRGVIANIKQSQPCQVGVIINQGNHSKTILLMDCCIQKDDFFNTIKLGDSLIKHKGEMTIDVIKPNGHRQQTFDYPFCFQ